MKRQSLLFGVMLALTLSSCGGLPSMNSRPRAYYKITWKNYDGRTLKTDKNVLEGSWPEYIGDTPTREENEYYKYTWSGWEPELHYVDANITYYATYTRFVKPTCYTVKFNTNGGTLIASVSVQQGDLLERPEDPTKDNCFFQGWYKDSDFYDLYDFSAPVNSSFELYAKWTVDDRCVLELEDLLKDKINKRANYQIANGYSIKYFTLKDTYPYGYTLHTYGFINFIYGGNEELVLGIPINREQYNALRDFKLMSYDSEAPVAEYYTLETLSYIKNIIGDEEKTFNYAYLTGDSWDFKWLFTKPLLSNDGKTITYGLYPQKKVDDSLLIENLNELTEPESNGWYLFEDNYYANVKADPCGYKYVFDNNEIIESGTTYWFKCEPIVWNVLSQNDNLCYVVSSVILDSHSYYHSRSSRIIDGKTVEANNYEYSDIRSWLNEDFYNSAFALENSHIQTTIVDNSADTTGIITNSYVCSDTEDKVFLPSYKDYIDSNYGFSTELEISDTRYCKTTDWARARGTFVYSQTTNKEIYMNNGCYWTRSPHSDSPDHCWVVSCGGSLADGLYVNTSEYSVRPAITVNLLGS